MSIDLEKANLSSYNYQLNVNSRFTEICNPLKQLGITYFSYLKIFPDGSYLGLCEDLDLAKAYLSTIEHQGEYFNKTIFTNLSNNYKYFLLPNDIELYEKSKNPLVHLMYDFHAWNVLGIYRVDKSNVYEQYCFGTRRELKDFFPTIYLENMALFNHFINYFNEKAQDLIDTKDKNRLAYHKIKYNTHTLSKETKLTHSIASFFAQTSLEQRFIRNKGQTSILTKRQYECLAFLSEGYGLKSIANFLNLSPRTVEHYLNIIKRKTDCKSRAQLVKAFISNSGVL